MNGDAEGGSQEEEGDGFGMPDKDMIRWGLQFVLLLNLGFSIQ
jgi:hypothetical protein